MVQQIFNAHFISLTLMVLGWQLFALIQSNLLTKIKEA